MDGKTQVNFLQGIFNILNIPLGWILKNISALFGGNFAAAVFVFTLLVNLAMIPLSIKSQKSSVQQIRLKPKLDELKKKYGDDRNKYATETQRLYQEEGVSMSGGCLPMLIRLPIMMSIYYLICSPLTYLMNVSADVITKGKEQLTALGLKFSEYNAELQIIDNIESGKFSIPEIAEKIGKIDFDFFGINLTESPKFSLNIFADFKPIWILPILAFAAAMVSSLISLAMSKKTNPDAPNMAGMLLTMPIMSLIIGFSVPGGVAFYWACSSLISGVIQAVVQMTYGPHRLIARENAKSIIKTHKSELTSIKNSAERKEGN